MRGFCVIPAVFCVCAAAQGQNTADDLLQLIRANDLAGLKTRLAGGVDVSTHDRIGNTPVAGGVDVSTHDRIGNAPVARGVNVSTHDRIGNAPLARGVDVNTHDRIGNTPLMLAAEAGSVEAVRLLLEAGADVNARNEFQTTALMLGAGNYDKVRLLVDKGADVKAANKNGRTPLMIAATCDGCAPIVKLLLDHGADANAVDHHKVSALRLAADADDLESMKLLLAHGAAADTADDGANDALQSAASNCNLAAVKLLLSKGAPVNSANTFSGEVKFGKIQLIGLTPLMLASTYCSAEVVKTLLDAGAKVNALDIRGMTPLMFSVSSEEQNTAVARALIHAGADVNARSKADETALDWARKFGNPRMLAALKEAGAKDGAVYAPPERKTAGTRSALEAVTRGTAVLQHGASEFFKQSGCVGCHHQPAALSAVTAARAAGVKVADAEAVSYVKMMEGQSMAFQQTLLDRGDSGGLIDPWLSLLTSLKGERYPPAPWTDVVVAYVANFQRRDGSWWAGGVSRAPLEEGHMARTALAVRVMRDYGTPAMKTDLDRRIARARDYMLKARAHTADEAAMQIAGLDWSGAPQERVRALARQVIAAQHSDGGWGSNPNLPSDAYATGETLWALRESGALRASEPVYRKGVEYLLATQCQDGSWYVRSRAPKFQPYFQSGFPFEHDQWISSAGTSWAVRALAPAIENEKTASR